MACFQLPSARVPVSRQNIVSFKFSQKFPVEGTGSSKITLSLYLMTFYIKQKSFGNEPFFFLARGYFSFIFPSSAIRAHISECLSEYCLSQRESIHHWEKINFCFVHYRWDALCFLNDVSDKPTQARARLGAVTEICMKYREQPQPAPPHHAARSILNDWTSHKQAI